MGFDGTDEDWSGELAGLCQENGRCVRDGIDADLLLRLADDQSDSQR